MSQYSDYSSYPNSSNYYVSSKINNTDNRYVSSNYNSSNYNSSNYTNTNNYTNNDNNNYNNSGNSRLREFKEAGRSVLLDTSFKR